MQPLNYAVAEGTAGKDFPDIAGHWAEDVIRSIANKGILSGFPDGNFYPDEILTNAQTVVIFVKALGITPVSTANTLHWADPYIEAAIKAGIVKEGEIPHNYENAACTREYAAVLTARALRYRQETLPSQAEIDKQTKYITDLDSVRNLEDVKLCMAVGVISGMPTKRPDKLIFEPNGIFTRAQGASLIERVLDPAKRVKPSDIAVDCDILVAKDGTGDFKSIGEAIRSVSDDITEPVTIYIRNGTYKEKIRLNKGKNYIRLVGEDNTKTIITGDDYINKPLSDGSVMSKHDEVATVCIQANDFTAENLTIENTAGSIERAIAVFVSGDRCVFRNCKITSYQDTLYVRDNRQYFENCFIAGCVDFIYGGSTAVFNKCTIYSEKLDRNSGGYITAASTDVNNKYGYVFLNCDIIGNTPTGSTYLGRPWGDYACVTFINCSMGEHIRPEGWHNWGSVKKETTARYAEYNSTGPGANPEARVNWSRQLTDEEAKEYTIENVLKGSDNWMPEIKVD